MSKVLCASLFCRIQVTLGEVGMGEGEGVGITGEDGGIREVEEKLQGTWDFGWLGTLGGSLQPLEGLVGTHLFGGIVESPDKLQEKLIKGGKGNILQWSHQAR
jgi:hypothetical protein